MIWWPKIRPQENFLVLIYKSCIGKTTSLTWFLPAGNLGISWYTSWYVFSLDADYRCIYVEFHTPTPADGVTHSLLITSDVGITSLSQTTCVSRPATCIYSWILVLCDPRLVLHPFRHIRPADRDLLPPPRSIEPRLPPTPTTWSVNPDLAIRSNPIRPCPGNRISPMKP